MAHVFEVEGCIKSTRDVFVALDKGTMEAWNATLLTDCCSDPKLFCKSLVFFFCNDP